MPSTTAEPASLLTAAGPATPEVVAPPPRFLIFSQQWLDLQSYVTASLRMPLTTNDFERVYGAFPASETQIIRNVVQGLTKIAGLATDFGDPVALKRRIQVDPGYLNGKQPPREIYAHIVWLANQIHNAAGTFSYTLAELVPLLSAMDEKQRAATVKTILTGPGGLVSIADDMKTKSEALIQKLAAFEQPLSAANEQVQHYIGQESALIGTADGIIGSFRKDIDERLRPAADGAYKKWRDYTIAAVTTSVGLAVLSMGLLLPLAIGLGTGLGVAASKFRDQYNGLMSEIATKEHGIKQKTQLVSDMRGFNVQMAAVGPALTSFKGSLEAILGVWTSISANLAYIVKTYSPAQLADVAWLNQAMAIGVATTKWKAIGETSLQFTQTSLVSYSFGTSFGQTFPA